MKGDFTRDSFESHKRFTRVLQSRAAYSLTPTGMSRFRSFGEYWRNFTRDLVGPFAGPHGKCGFGIIPCSGDRRSSAVCRSVPPKRHAHK